MAFLDNKADDPRAMERILRETAMQERDENKRMALRGAADTLTNAITVFTINRNAEALRDLQGVWAYSTRLLQLVTSAEPTPPLSSAQDVRKAA